MFSFDAWQDFKRRRLKLDAKKWMISQNLHHNRSRMPIVKYSLHALGLIIRRIYVPLCREFGLYKRVMCSPRLNVEAISGKIERVAELMPYTMMSQQRWCAIKSIQWCALEETSKGEEPVNCIVKSTSRWIKSPHWQNSENARCSISNWNELALSSSSK